jgi:osmotically-inducible protein OsmY
MIGQISASWRMTGTVAGVCFAALALGACVPMVGGAFVKGTLVATDRRTSGAQLEDESIELRANARLREAFADKVHVNVASYNRQVLLTGEVSTAQDRQRVEEIVARLENVRNVVNELAILGNSTLPQRSSDSLVTGKVKASLVDAKDLYANAFKVVTERGTTYLMGRVSQREADQATEVARSVAGVQRLVRVFEIISEEELQRLQSSPPPAEKPGR